MPPMKPMGMESMKCVIKNGKWGQWLKRFNLSANFLYNMVEIFANTGNALTPNCLRTPNMPNMKAQVSAGGYHQSERGQYISPTGKGPVHIPNRKGAMVKECYPPPPPLIQKTASKQFPQHGEESKMATQLRRGVPKTITTGAWLDQTAYSPCCVCCARRSPLNPNLAPICHVCRVLLPPTKTIPVGALFVPQKGGGSIGMGG